MTTNESNGSVNDHGSPETQWERQPTLLARTRLYTRINGSGQRGTMQVPESLARVIEEPAAKEGLGVGETKVLCVTCLPRFHFAEAWIHAPQAIERGEGHEFVPHMHRAVAIDRTAGEFMDLPEAICPDCGRQFRNAPPSAPVRPPQTVPDQVLTPLSLDAWGEYHRALDFGTLNEISVAREAVEAAIRAPLVAAMKAYIVATDDRFEALRAYISKLQAQRPSEAEFNAVMRAEERHRETLLDMSAALAGVPKEAGNGE